ncbi:hypothetical protein INR77_08100 [Erythrobacter sp. SCSIO 43205]|uniref:hypothetical protein n=1 Tax=Erythrobacter sp. SCSIO 43205 TaxID=2779361 RepID=UPI001CA965F1|nr:hypothetical protein [Erythrobacter sp. SCSIO 43205]UAB76824.1 hypothetical protein INR77_08100 [Erythrobacter sp. SCSIO 43205]
MLAILITLAIMFAGLVAVLSLTDTWLKARAAFWAVFEERELLDAGFVPQVEAEELRIRRPLHKTARRAPQQRRQRQRGFGGSARSQLGAVQSLG